MRIALGLAVCLLLALLLNFVIGPQKISTAGTTGSADAIALKAIEDVQVGDRVLTKISEELRELARAQIGTLPFWDERSIDPEDWRKIELTLNRDDGSEMEITLLRPLVWLRENGIVAGREINLSLPEMKQAGLAQIKHVAPCPTPHPGDGSVVTGTFASTVGMILAINIEGVSEPILSTPEHPFYRIDDHRFIGAAELRPGDHIQHLSGSARIERVVLRTGEFRVYNLEVHECHVFRVASSGVLVHNAWGAEQTAKKLLMEQLRRRKNAEYIMKELGETVARDVDKAIEIAGGIDSMRLTARQAQDAIDRMIANPN